MGSVLERAEARQEIAEHILQELHLVNRWGQFGTCNVIGAVAYHLVVARDVVSRDNPVVAAPSCPPMTPQILPLP